MGISVKIYTPVGYLSRNKSAILSAPDSGHPKQIKNLHIHTIIHDKLFFANKQGKAFPCCDEVSHKYNKIKKEPPALLPRFFAVCIFFCILHIRNNIAGLTLQDSAQTVYCHKSDVFVVFELVYRPTAHSLFRHERINCYILFFHRFP